MGSSAKQPVLTLGVSGVSCSGKTTLARLLRDIWPNSFILHEDDFYWPDTKIPVKNGVQDWDCLEAINLEALQQALVHIRKHASSPPDLVSKEDQNAIGESGVSTDTVERFKEEAKKLAAENNLPRLAIIDGFLLFSENMYEIRELFDLRLFLNIGYNLAKSRRNSRTGYVTLEGFWEDPPGYVDDVVWPNYVKEHKFLFKNGDVNGEFDTDVCQELDLHTMPSDAQQDMTRCLKWANEIVQQAMLDAKKL